MALVNVTEKLLSRQAFTECRGVTACTAFQGTETQTLSYVYSANHSTSDKRDLIQIPTAHKDDIAHQNIIRLKF